MSIQEEEGRNPCRRNTKDCLTLAIVIVIEGLIKERLASTTRALQVKVSSLQVVYNCYYNCLEAGILIQVKLSLHYRHKGYLAVVIDLLVSYIVAYSLVKDVLRQANVYKRLLEIRKAETEQEEAIIVVEIN